MRVWGIFSTIAMGFVLGMILAGVGGISAGITAAHVEKRLRSDRIQDYWATTQLNHDVLEKFINNKKCVTSDKYFLACVNAVISILEKTSSRLTLSAQIQKASLKTVQFDNFNERENLVGFNQIFKEGLAGSFDFEKLIETAIELNKEDPVQYSMALAINGFLSVYKDPHTYILPIAYFNEVTSVSERSPYFVGISFEKKQGRVYVRKIFKNSDADKSGLQVGDRVLSLNGQNIEAKTLAEISMLLKSKNFRSFTFLIERENVQFLKTVQRSFRVLNQVSSEMIPDTNYGLIQISKFSIETCNLVRDAIQEMSNHDMNGLILDLRDNPGGRLSEASCLAGLFLGANQRVYSVKYFDPILPNEVVLSKGDKIYSGALVVLINNNSASASELLAGALQEHQRALVVGQRSFGKGTFQEIESWNDDETIKLFKTKGFYLLPSGETTQLSGLSPDFHVLNPEEETSEQNNYFNPINPEIYGLKSHQLEQTLPLSQCSMNIVSHEGDAYISAAQQLLKCTQVMSEVATRFAESQLKIEMEQ